MGSYINKEVEVEGKRLKLTNLNKVLYPKTGFTKADILDYYTKISRFMLPHVDNRMLTLKRYPEGTDHEFFYEKRCPPYKPDWMKTTKIKRTHHEGNIPYCEVENLAGLLWIANLASIEFHVLLSTNSDPKTPTTVVFDLDPGPGMTFHDCCRTALKMQNLFKGLKLETFPKTSGGKGLHFYIPLNTKVTFEQTKLFAHQVALFFERKYPDEVVSNMKKTLREGKIFLDWSQNDDHKTTVCVYSLRGKEKPFVSTPLTWKEVEDCAKNKNDAKYQFVAPQVIKRVNVKGDMFEPVLHLKQKLPVFKQ